MKFQRIIWKLRERSYTCPNTQKKPVDTSQEILTEESNPKEQPSCEQVILPQKRSNYF